MTIRAIRYRPKPEQATTLRRAMEHVRSVPYQVSARWLFYRLLQDGIYRAKDDYRSMIRLLSRARKGFYEEWRPDTLADTTREASHYGFGYNDPRDWLKRSVADEECRLDLHRSQPVYVELWFEAHAMRGQFEYHTSDVTLRPFGGDPSIPYKWEAAKELARFARAYQHEVVILYFGDLDPKGMTIPESAWGDISGWLVTEFGIASDRFTFIRCGLNPGDEVRLAISANPEKPGTYQWEALTDEQAGDLIRDALEPYVDEDAKQKVVEQAKVVTRHFHDWLLDHLDEALP